jgi:hypothetical protein
MFIYSYCYISSVLCMLSHCVFLCTVCVQICTPPNVNLNAVNKIYHISQQITTTCFVTSQKNAVLTYLAEEALNHANWTKSLNYRVIKKSLWSWWLQYRKLRVMFKMYPASLQIFINTPNCVLEDHVQYGTVHIPNVFCDGRLQIINFVGIVRYYGEVVFAVIMRCTETFLSPCSYAI